MRKFDEKQLATILEGALNWASETGDDARIYFDFSEKKFFWTASAEGSYPDCIHVYTISADEAEDHSVNFELIELVLENTRAKLENEF